MSTDRDELGRQVLRLAGGFKEAQAIYVVARLGVPTILLREGPMRVVELAVRTFAATGPLRRLIRSLTPIGLFSSEGDRVAVTDLGATLADEHPQSVLATVCMLMETHYMPFSDLLHTVRTGQPAADSYFGESFFTWVAEEPSRAALFAKSMAELNTSMRSGFLDNYRLPPGRIVADIGGADGSVLVQLLTSEPGRRGLVFDRPTMVPAAQNTIADAGLTDRVEVVSGDFFRAVPGADVYILCNVLHDWNDEECERILGSIRRAALNGAQLVVLECVIPSDDGPHLAKSLDLTMLGVQHGRERDEAEYRALFWSAGFIVKRIMSTPSPLSVIEATVRSE